MCPECGAEDTNVDYYAVWRSEEKTLVFSCRCGAVWEVEQ